MRSHIAPSNRIVRLGLAAIVAMTTFVAFAKTCKAQSVGEEPRQRDPRPGEAEHLHGYDIEITVEEGKPQTMAFRARATGRFPIEMHGGRHTVLVYLEVHPR